jgi:lysophospholipid acyltransferase (LPLAT)-like uncharacterized protein
MDKPVRKEKFSTRLVIRFGHLFLRLLRRLLRVEYVDRHIYENLLKSGESVLIAIWHGRILLPILEHKDSGIKVLVSLSRDGEMIARTIERLGFETVRGSSSRRSREALNEMISALQVPGTIAAIMPDGPTGPPRKAKPGVIQMARSSGALVLPVSFRAKRGVDLKSWDSFHLWKPFTQAVLVYGEPLRLSADGKLRSQLAELEEALNQVERRADTWFQSDDALPVDGTF